MEKKKIIKINQNSFTKSSADKLINEAPRLVKDNELDCLEDQTPAPGFYHNEQVISSIKIANKPEKF